MVFSEDICNTDADMENGSENAKAFLPGSAEYFWLNKYFNGITSLGVKDYVRIPE